METPRHEWLTTNPRPGTSALLSNTAQTGWKMHAIVAKESDSPEDVRFLSAACGLRARHGWGVDFHITEKCTRCTAAIAKLKM